MHRIMIAGIGTEVGKTIVSAIVVEMLNADYWKPIQCGDLDNSDSHAIARLTQNVHIHQSTYSLKSACSPHLAAKIENLEIDLSLFKIPTTTKSLVIEGVGGVYVPLTPACLTVDVFKIWQCKWVIVSKNYLGSINHTLLTIDALNKHNISILGLVFNGESNPSSEAIISSMTKLPILGRINFEPNLNPQIIQRYASQWLPQFQKQLN